ncbi:hypothetical protein [Arthrospira platensis]|jgi:hypothetical protein|uniref:Transposase n=1 Tax=Limnospira platensis NIES-46 TaxID=1236695 RepID=A0A5M3T982_LIMPL|nr:hypothetical protein [Arthrospira platensis]MBD2670511.1 hypothetical protein [Arthrospira platensis FACHB-439]MBD2711170.1 hypothetical protein [Arthrospira platensis FACHB-835]MDT9184520.1 hypothetical protein [Limnospira sp. PMC 289.06]MDT9312303.1 hypothetical protein [Limnospira sp. Paracas R14]MBD2574176.1 hypothetical protein [Arthrospira platensis FACHB-971]
MIFPVRQQLIIGYLFAWRYLTHPTNDGLGASAINYRLFIRLAVSDAPY